mgnify:FL=1
MDGKTLKSKVKTLDISQAQLARLMEVTPQTLASVFMAKDVRSGTIERIAEVLNIPPTFFYSSTPTGTAIASGTQAVAAVNSRVSTSAELYKEVELLKQKVEDQKQIIYEKERLISLLMNRQQ